MLKSEKLVEWVYAGKLQHGPEFLAMQRTRSAFKLSLRYCRQHEQEITADYLAHNLSDKRYDKFCSSIRKGNNSKASVKVNVINGCSGDSAISEMWKSHFEALYNSVDGNGEKEVSFIECHNLAETLINVK